MTDLSTFEPKWVSAPGDTIADLLEERGWTQADLATRTGFTKKHINDLVAGRVSVTPDAALRLETALGGSAAFWLAREGQYREALLRDQVEAELTRESGWLAELPLRHMWTHGWLKRVQGKGAQVAECLRFFGVSSVEAWRQAYEQPLGAFRAAKKPLCLPAVAAWLRQGEIEASRISCGGHDAVKFRNALNQLRGLTQEPDPRVFVSKLTRECAAVGVAIAFVPAPTGCPVFGFTKWMAPTRALLLLSLRYKTNDQLWFTFFHEAGHLLLHGKRLVFLEGADGLNPALEAEADRFAGTTLIPETYEEEFRALPRTRVAVQAFASRVGVAPGIVVGRLQHDGALPWTHLNDLKVRYAWKPPEASVHPNTGK